jgi:hypothetical protein
MPVDTPARRRDALTWIWVAISLGELAVVIWVCVTRWDAVIHGHPAYAVVLAVTTAGAIGFGVVALAGTAKRSAWRLTGRVLLAVLALAWIAAVAWLRPYGAVEPALTAMQTDSTVVVTETSTRIVLAPATDAGDVGVFFQPGALVDARAYAAVLRPLAEAGHVVVITKQPLGIAFLAVGDFGAARAEHPQVSRWVAGGHSLGGTVAAIEVADDPDAAGLLFFASYPAGDLSDLAAPVLSISGTRDGLATPDKIEASRADLSSTAEFVVIDGASHAQFGDYGPQAGDDEPTLSHDEARDRISTASVAFVDTLG